MSDTENARMYVRYRMPECMSDEECQDAGHINGMPECISDIQRMPECMSDTENARMHAR